LEEGGQKFKSSDYWSSDKRNNYEAFVVNFGNGKVNFYSKLEKNPFRCVRKN
jgi:hypothetical protein